MTLRHKPDAPYRLPSDLKISRTEFERLRDLIQRHAGIHLTQAKTAMVTSRLLRRLRDLELTSFSQYLDYLAYADKDGLELERMINRITTNQTKFFRENHHFDFLTEHLLPQFRSHGEKTGRRRLRAWSAACSTGQEAYSLAMTLAAGFGSAPGWDLRVMATDLDTEVLTKASLGQYSEEEIASLKPEQRTTWFNRLKDDRGRTVYRVNQTLRRLIVFRRFNLLRFPYPLKIDLDFIFCRNVIIYFNQLDKIRLLEEMHRVLAPGGHLFIGHSESLMASSSLFEYVADTVYKKVVA